jgi:hypothetical protein
MSKKCPPSGSGRVNSWTWATACEGKKLGWSPEKVRQHLWENTTHSADEAEYEIERAVSRVFSVAGIPAAKRIPLRDDALIRKICASDGGLATLEDNSPVKGIAQAELLPQLFPTNPLIWAAYRVSPERADTRPLDRWLPHANRLQFIVPNPMRTRDIPEGGKSRRCEKNTGERRFLVIERDRGSLDEQSAILLYLARFAPLVMVVHSGGKSLHGWFFVAGRAESKNKQFMDLAVSAGADHHTQLKCQPVRMPEGTRDNGTKQRVLLFSPELLRGEAAK